MLFFKTAERNYRREMLDLAVSIRVGVNADKKSWKEYVREMSKVPVQSRKAKVTGKLDAKVDTALRQWFKKGAE
jgi:hypothetical protein